MTRSLYETLTTPPPRRPPPRKHPLFTKDPFSTTSFGPGHLVRAGILVLGVVGLAKFIDARRSEAARLRRGAADTRPLPPTPPAEPKFARVENHRGQYGVPGSRP